LNGWGTEHVRGKYTQGFNGDNREKRSLGRSRGRWEFNIKMYIQEIE